VAKTGDQNCSNEDCLGVRIGDFSAKPARSKSTAATAANVCQENLRFLPREPSVLMSKAGAVSQRNSGAYEPWGSSIRTGEGADAE